MSFHFLDGNSYGAYSDTGPGEIIVDPTATINTNGAGVSALTLATGDWVVTVTGAVLAGDGYGVNLKDAGNYFSQIKVDEGAAIVGGGPSGIGVNAAHATNVINEGVISGPSTGINESGDGDFSISNTGVIDGGRYGIRASFSGDHLIANGGTISGGEYAILGENGNEQVLNTGTLNGNVHLGDGNDTFKNFDREGDNQLDGIVTGTIDLGRGDDTFQGGANKEVVRDGDGKDTISLGGGDDFWFSFLAGGDDGDDTVNGGAGVDTYDASQSGVQGVRINLDSAAHAGLRAMSADDDNASAAADSISGFENALGTNFADIVFGTNGANTLVGRDGNDTLSGLNGNDTLKGDAGADTLVGGRGKDSLFGGADGDIFDFNSIKESLTGSNRDVIQDFKRGTDDIDLIGIDAKKGVDGNQKFKWIGKQDFHDKKGELRYEDKGSKVIVQGDVNGDGKPDFEIMVKVGALSTGDFLL